MSNVERGETQAIDIGGTGYRVAGVSQEGTLTTEVARYSHELSQDALDLFREHVLRVQDQVEARGGTIYVAGIGMPGPANYEQGRLLATHKPNLVPLCNVDLREVLASQHGQKGLEAPIYFLNDGDALGNGVIQEFPGDSRLFVIGLGTGTGSSFAVDGRLATEEDGAPANREIWNMPFGNEGEKFEDYVSRAAIISGFEGEGGQIGLDVKEIAALARLGYEPAIISFKRFSENLGKGVAKVAKDFHPTRLVLGGNIGRGAFDLIEGDVRTVLNQSGIAIPVSTISHDYLAIVGAAHFAQEQFARETEHKKTL